MKLVWRSTLSIMLLLGCAFGVANSARAATVTVTLLPGKLAITNAPATLTYAAAPSADVAGVYTTTFTIAITDATGSRAGWHIQAALSAVVDDIGAAIPVSAATITDAAITTQTGRAPIATLAYPRPFHTDGDMLFSAATGSGMGKSLLAFTTELRMPADSPASDECNAALAVTILSGP